MKRGVFFIGCAGLILGLTILVWGVYNAMGVTGEAIEVQARESQNIPESWEVSKQTTENLSAMIFYNDTQTQHTFSLYVRRTGGYFFRQGGIATAVAAGVRVFNLEGIEENAYISMNSKGLSLVQITKGTTVETVDLDPNEPFAVIVHENAGVSFFDADGNVLYEKQPEQQQ